jgi:hypothetical protein
MIGNYDLWPTLSKHLIFGLFSFYAKDCRILNLLNVGFGKTGLILKSLQNNLGGTNYPEGFYTRYVLNFDLIEALDRLRFGDFSLSRYPFAIYKGKSSEDGLV